MNFIINCSILFGMMITIMVVVHIGEVIVLKWIPKGEIRDKYLQNRKWKKQFIFSLFMIYIVSVIILAWSTMGYFNSDGKGVSVTTELPVNFKEPTNSEIKQQNIKSKTLNEQTTQKERVETTETNNKLVEEALKNLN